MRTISNNQQNRYFIRISGEEVGWVYYHNIGDFEDEKYIQLFNEQIPGESIKFAEKVDYKEISKEQYEKILDVINEDKDATPHIHNAINSD